MKLKELEIYFPFRHKKQFKRNLRKAVDPIDQISFRMAGYWGFQAELLIADGFVFIEAFRRAEEKAVEAFLPSGYQYNVARGILAYYWKRGKRIPREY